MSDHLHKPKNVMTSGVFATQSLLAGKPKAVARSRPLEREEEHSPQITINHEERHKEHR